MMAMIYCNHCFDTKDDTQRQYFITGCFHVFCDGCIKTSKNFCLVCKKGCKILPINSKLPAEVKAYFDPNSIEKMVGTIEKISQFKLAQNKAYVAKNIGYREKYFKYKKSILDLKKANAKVDEAIAREKAIISKLEDAYKTKLISPRLFQMGSPMIDHEATASSSGYMSDMSSSTTSLTLAQYNQQRVKPPTQKNSQKNRHF